MNLTQLDSNYWVSPQITVEDVAEAKNQGFDTIVCNRPDGESDDQTPAVDIARAAADQGIKFVELPMRGPNYSKEQVDTLSSLLDSQQKILGYCRTGNRSSVLYRAVKGEG
ncbi:TIGR01244 family sulfur transferase [Saccharospirillum salsuginis]|uniref:Oxidoreductase n=1 Tax=Saccharospirillum salsuginis TaxID=418750 RepID=A0A918N6M5_9GAMM|nr:TIGR01244 family sulfur transferase [Saccharospirillum salsuginis]GGX39843.1 oxidoreductase [Saccharospirillum salsuginis]